MTAPIQQPQDGAQRWTAQTVAMGFDILDRMERAVAKVRDRLLRATGALNQAGIVCAVVGGNAVASWVATVDEGAVRNTRDVDLLVRRDDLPAITTALANAGFVRDELLDMVMLREGAEGKPSEAVRLLFAAEKVRPNHLLQAPEIRTVDELIANRNNDLMHLRDMIDVGLINSSWLAKLPPVLAERLKQILDRPDG
jgi:hypothetical protein